VRWKRTPHTRLSSRYGQSQVVLGRLTTIDGTPIAGAQIDVDAAPAATGAPSVAMAPARTAPDGSFRVLLPGGTSSRTLRFAYRMRIGDPAPVAERSLTLSVSAGIRLSIAPRIASVGRTIRFRGRLLGRPIPSAGKQLILEARSPRGRWLQFKVVRSNARGQYRASYRFRFPGPAVYQFRVRSEAESDYPYAAGSSRIITVHER
jgi:hypothetical protein